MRGLDDSAIEPGDDDAVVHALAIDLEVALGVRLVVARDHAAADGPAVALELARRLGGGRLQDGRRDLHARVISVGRG